MQSSWREAQREGDFRAEDIRRGVDLGDLDQHPRSEFVAIVGGEIVAEAGGMLVDTGESRRVLQPDHVSGAIVVVVPIHRRKFLGRLALEIGD